ncbi:MAG: nucleotidyltransferase family protein [Nitrospirae bacterium]|nr:nucleotidyltransferase family protein [Nitrospirota bacterium]
MNKERALEILRKNSDILRGFHVKALYLFGSLVRGDEKQTSDVDLLVEFEPEAQVGLFEFSRLQRTLSEMLGCEVDLATPDALHKALKGQIMEEVVRAA